MLKDFWRGRSTGYRGDQDEEAPNTLRRASLNPFGDGGGTAVTMENRPYRDGGGTAVTMENRPYRDGGGTAVTMENRPYRDAAVTPAWSMLDRQHSSPITPTFEQPLQVSDRGAPVSPDDRERINREGLPEFQSSRMDRAAALSNMLDPFGSREAGRDFTNHQQARDSGRRQIEAMELARVGINPRQGGVRMMTPREEAEYDLGPQKKRSKWRMIGETVLGALYGMGTGRGAIAGGIMGATGDLARQVREAEINKRMGPITEQRTAMEADEEKRRGLQDRDLNNRYKLAQIGSMERDNLPQGPKPINPIQMWDADLPVTPEMATALNLPKEYIGKRKSDFVDPKRDTREFTLRQADGSEVRYERQPDGTARPISLSGGGIAVSAPELKDLPRPTEGEINAQRRVAIDEWSGTPEAQQAGTRAFIAAAGESRDKLNAEIAAISQQINALTAPSAGITTTSEGDGIAAAKTQARFGKTDVDGLRARHSRLLEAIRKGDEAARQEIERQGGVMYDRTRSSGGTGSGRQQPGASRIPGGAFGGVSPWRQ